MGWQPQAMNFPNGVPKDLRVMLEERKVRKQGLDADILREI